MSNCYPSNSYGLTANRLLNALFNEESVKTWNPPVDVTETDAHYQIITELPGVSPGEVKVVVRDGVLSLTGERTATPATEGSKSHVTERPFGAFQRRFNLPKDADGERVSAEFKNGLLLIFVPKRDEVKPKEIEIKVA